MRDLLDSLTRLEAGGARVGRAVVASVWGSAPRPEGASLLATADGTIAGSVSGGCVESATAEEIAAAIGGNRAKLVTFGVTHETAWAVGLACGGTIKVWVEPAVRPELVAAARAGGGACFATVIAGAVPLGATLLVRDDGAVSELLPPVAGDAEAGAAVAALAAIAGAVEAAAHEALARDTSRNIDIATAAGPVTVLLEVIGRPPTLLIVGGVHIAVALVPLAKRLGYRTVVTDGREAFLRPDRFPDADELLLAWPEEAFARIGLTASTFVVVLSHDPKFDEPACELALRSPAKYVGAIGSKKTQAARREQLRRAGFDDAALARLRGPIGLDIGGRDPAETALAILAEMTAVRYGRTGAALTA